MRIDIKTVKNRKYLQFIDKQNDVFHIGSASDFDSWVISAILWDQHWTKEYYERRRDFFDLLESEMEKHIILDDGKKESFFDVRSQKVYPSWEPTKRLRVPKKPSFGHLENNENIKQRRFRPMIWCPTELGATVQKRLNEISAKQTQLAQKNKQVFNMLTKKETQLKAIREQQNRIQRITTDTVQKVLSVIMEIEREKGTALKDEVILAKTLENVVPQEEIERVIRQLLREGTIYEPGDGRLKKT
jgi:hypothetical protein